MISNQSPLSCWGALQHHCGMKTSSGPGVFVMQPVTGGGMTYGTCIQKAGDGVFGGALLSEATLTPGSGKHFLVMKIGKTEEQHQNYIFGVTGADTGAFMDDTMHVCNPQTPLAPLGCCRLHEGDSVRLCADMDSMSLHCHAAGVVLTGVIPNTAVRWMINMRSTRASVVVAGCIRWMPDFVWKSSRVAAVAYQTSECAAVRTAVTHQSHVHGEHDHCFRLGDTMHDGTHKLSCAVGDGMQQQLDHILGVVHGPVGWDTPCQSHAGVFVLVTQTAHVVCTTSPGIVCDGMESMCSAGDVITMQIDFVASPGQCVFTAWKNGVMMKMCIIGCKDGGGMTWVCSIRNPGGHITLAEHQPAVHEQMQFL